MKLPTTKLNELREKEARLIVDIQTKTELHRMLTNPLFEMFWKDREDEAVEADDRLRKNTSSDLREIGELQGEAKAAHRLVTMRTRLADEIVKLGAELQRTTQSIHETQEALSHGSARSQR